MKDKPQEMTLGQKLRELRLAQKLTQKELAGDFITRNMLSQIENDSATPSIKTIEYLAEKLKKPVSYFMDKEEKSHSHMIEELMEIYEEGKYMECLDRIEEYQKLKPEAQNNDLLRNIYTNCCMRGAKKFKKEGDYEKAKALYEKTLHFERDMTFTSDIMLYNIYNSLAEVNAQMDVLDDSKNYDDKASKLVKKMVAERVIQSIYISFVEGHHQDVIARIKELNVEELDDYNRGRYYMIIGSAYYYQNMFEEAIDYLEKAIPYYKNITYNSVIIMIYEQLSKCYSYMEDYKKAYEYLDLAGKEKRGSK